MLYKLVLLVSVIAVVSEAAVPELSLDPFLLPFEPSTLIEPTLPTVPIVPFLSNEVLPPLLPEATTKATITTTKTTTTRKPVTTTRKPVPTTQKVVTTTRKIVPVQSKVQATIPTLQKVVTTSKVTTSAISTSAAKRFNVGQGSKNSGAYNYDYKLENGIQAQSSGSLRTSKDDPTRVFGVVKGEYSYVDPKGDTVIVTYTADEFGYRPKFRIIPAKRT